MKQQTVQLCLTSLLISSYSSGMLLQRAVKTQKYIRAYRMKSLGSETIFNTTNQNPKHQLELLENLYERNEKEIHILQQQIQLLQQQNDIATETYRNHSVNIDKLKFLEIQIHEEFSK